MRAKRIQKKLIGWGAYVLFLLVICEVALRIYLVHFASPERFQVYASQSMMEDRFTGPVIVPHPLLGYENTPNYDNGVNVHDSHGFRGKEVLQDKPAGVFRIVCLGGSTTYSTGVEDYRDAYPYLLEQELNALGVQVEVINAGVRGYSSLQSLINYQTKVKALKSDMLLVYHAVNDLWPRVVWPPEAYKADQSGAYTPQVPPENGLARKLSLFRIPLVMAGVIRPAGDWNNIVKVQDTNHSVELEEQLARDTYPSGIFETVPLDSMLRANKPVFFRNNLKALIGAANDNNTEVVLATFTYSKTHPEYITELKLAPLQNGIAEHNEIIRELSREYDLPLIDLERTFMLKNEWLTDGMHFNVQGNQLRAEKIAEMLLPMIHGKKPVRNLQ